MRNTALAIAVLTTVSFGAISASHAVEVRPMNSTTTAGDMTVDRSYKGVDISPNTSVGVGSTTFYNQPGRGADGPVQGTQRGSTADPSYGAVIEHRF